MPITGNINDTFLGHPLCVNEMIIYSIIISVGGELVNDPLKLNLLCILICIAMVFTITDTKLGFNTHPSGKQTN